MARKKRGPNKRPYPITPAVRHQRTVAPLKHGKYSSVVNEVIKGMGLTEDNQKLLEDVRLDIWKQFQTPALMLMDEYANFKTMVNAKLMSGADPTDKDIQGCLKLLLDISKEINRLTQVSADKKFEALTKDARPDGDMVINIKEKDNKNVKQ